MNQNGLTTVQVQEKIRSGKVNAGEESVSSSFGQIFAHHTFTYFNLVNCILFALILLSGQLKNGLFFFTVLTNTAIGIFQEYRSRKILDRMHIMIEAKVSVCRDGRWSEIGYREIVQDDYICLKAGMQVPADAVLDEGGLEVNESILTGESDILEKKPGDPVYSGTVITSGKAYAHVTKVGTDCAASQILKHAKKYAPARSELHGNLERMIRGISVIILPVSLLLFGLHYFVFRLAWQDALVKTVAAAVGMLPEGLIVLTSIALAAGAVALARKNVLVQDIYSIESLARVDTLCLDKTGTLTKGSLSVKDVIPHPDTDQKNIHRIMRAYLAAQQTDNFTEKALKDHFGTDGSETPLAVLPFASDRKYSAVTFADGTYYLGAPNFVFTEHDPWIEEVSLANALAGQRILVLAHGTSRIPEDKQGLSPLAVFIISDILQDNVQEIISFFRKQDVCLKVISGDDPRTVSAIAAQAGIQNADHYTDLHDDPFPTAEEAESCTVFGRVSPSQKKDLIGLLKKNGHTVAMIGDGVNDVPALKSADVSAAMGNGTDAAKDSANIILLNSSFAQMPSIVNEGRRVIHNITRASSMYLVKTIFSLLLLIYVLILQKEYPFIPIHLTVISAFCVGIPTFLLQFEPNYDRVREPFFETALKNAIPGAIMIFLYSFAAIIIKNSIGLQTAEYHTLLLAGTAVIYFTVLFRVYYPPTRLRKAVMTAMAAGLPAAVFFLQRHFDTAFTLRLLPVVIPVCLTLPLLVYALMKFSGKYVNQFLERRFSHGKKNAG